MSDTLPPRKHAALRENRPVTDADYRLMVDAVSDYAIFLLDPTGRVQSWNAGAERLTGYAAEEVIGRHFSLFYPQELVDRGWAEHELEMAQAQGRFEDEGWRLRKDGSRFWANIIITQLIGADGTLRGYSKITRDVSERRRHVEMLRHSEERFRLLVDGVKDYAIFMLDDGGHVASWNPGAEQMKGYAPGEIIGQHFSIFYPPEVAARGWPEHELKTAVAEGRYEEEGWRVRKDGSRFWANVVITPLHDETGRHRGFAKVTRDMTERRRITTLEDEGRRTSAFIAMLGHELRNPLAPITNALSILQRQQVDEQLARIHAIIARQVAQMNRLVDDLLDVGRITAGKIHLIRKPVRIQAAVIEAVEAVQPAVEARGHTLVVQTEGAEQLWVSADRTRLIQLVTNLLTNSAKFTPAGGHIDLSVVAHEGRVEIRVKDDGPGIAPALLPTIFNLFVQGEQDLARTQGGLGVGLSLVQQIATLHDGDVAAFSTGQPGQGAEFVVRLPTMPAPVEQAPAVSLPSGPPRRSVLVVDDNQDSADTLGMLLRMMGYAVTVLYSGRAAIEAVRTDPPDLMLLDIGLPDVTGLEVARRITDEVTRPPRIVAVTGYGQSSDRGASLAAGFHAHLTKPVDADALARLLKRLLE